MSTRSCNDTYIDVKLSLILPVIGLHYQLRKHVILHEMATLNQKKTSPCRMTVPCRQSSHHRAWSVTNGARSCRHKSLFLQHAYIYSPHWRQKRKSHRDADEITWEKLVYLASIRLRGIVIARNRKIFLHHHLGPGGSCLYIHVGWSWC